MAMTMKQTMFENAQEMASPPIAETRAGKRSAVHEFKNILLRLPFKLL